MAKRFKFENYEWINDYDGDTGYWQNIKTRMPVDPKTAKRIEAHVKANNITVNRSAQSAPKTNARTSVARVNNRYQKLFPKDINLNQTRKNPWAKTLHLSSGKNANYNYSKTEYKIPGRNKYKSTASNDKYGASIDSKIPPGSNVLKGTQGWVRHLQIAVRAVMLQSEYFRMALGRRALQVFRISFRNQRFYSQGTSKWKELATATLKKREWRRKHARSGTTSYLTILKEYGDLSESLDVMDFGEITRVHTKIVPANRAKFKHHSICYASLHNEGFGTIGNTSKPHIQRQFMGHSTYLDPFADRFIRMLAKRYLFDSVFVIKKI